MRKFRVLVFVFLLAVLLPACSTGDVYESVLLKEDGEARFVVSVYHEGNSVLRFEKSVTENYDEAEGGRIGVIKKYNAMRDNNLIYRLDVDYGESAYTVREKYSFFDVDLREYAVYLKDYGFPVSEDGSFVVYDLLLKEYLGDGFVLKSRVLKDVYAGVDVNCDSRDNDECQRVKNEVWQRSGEVHAIVFIVLMCVGTVVWEVVKLRRKADVLPKEYSNRMSG